MTKNNNFDFLRFLFALLVVVSHSYPLSGDNESSQWIYKITNGQLVLAQIGLSGFFIISGYFIFQSLERSNSILDYLKKRFLRLFPALAVVLILSIILIPFVYKGEVSFFKNIEVYTYLPYNLSLYGFQSSIKGVFDTNAYHSINGSLWTIRYEFTLYLVLALLFFLKTQKQLVRSILLASFAIFIMLYIFCLNRFGGSSLFGLKGIHILNLGTFFIGGSLLASLQFEKVKHKSIIFGISVLILLLSLYFNCYDFVKHIIFPIVIIALGFIPIPCIRTFGRFGDMSYRIYIYSFPIQQTLMYYFKMDTYSLLIYSVLLSIGFGYVSWHLIEKRALKIKRKFILNKNDKEKLGWDKIVNA
ncbi:acyltransferase [Flavobacterium sp. 83]|uniref:acyltransferase family protein n=1 Tax=Flavobacterium sp. 83 TaxID=1131812 RepID=UPI00068C455D|nr:acyltransferase [Flavobacterium sp. 83]